MTAAELHRLSRAEAVTLADTKLRGELSGLSPLIGYRLTSPFQADWKEEVGHWLDTAQRLGYFEPLLKRIGRARHPGGATPSEIDPNEDSHRILFQELAPAMVAHYLVGTGWSFLRWEPPMDRPASGPALDVDIELATPTGEVARLQVKGSDQLGRIQNYRVVDGENDQWVLAGIRKAATQLPADKSGVNLIVICAYRRWPLSLHPGPLVTALLGSTLQEGSRISLYRKSVGHFFDPQWARISGVVMLDYLRSVEAFEYPCTVLLNPNASVAAREEWFSRARVCTLSGTTFRWVRGEPGDDHTLPDGTELRD